MAIPRSVLSTGELYIKTLEEVSYIKLDADSLKRRDSRPRMEMIAEAVGRLNTGLTSGRKAFLAGAYLNDDSLREAYSIYYTTTNYLKLIAPLRELARSGCFDRTTPIRVLDLGSGSGAAMWGLLSFLESEIDSPISVEITAVDSIAQNLRDIQKFHNVFSSNCTIVTSSVETALHDLETQLPDAILAKRFHLIVMMNTLNELSTQAERSILNILPTLLEESGTAIVIEPATRNESRRLLHFRDAAVAENWTIYAPCTRQSNCPALEEESNWCHTNYKWERPEFIRVIDDLAGTLRLSLKSTYITMNRSGATLANSIGRQNLWRSVSDRFDEKGRVRSILCSEPGRIEFILNKRDKTDKNREFTKLERYDIIEITGYEQREHDARLLEASTAHIVLPVLGA